MKEMKPSQDRFSELERTARALKAARLRKGLDRQQAAQLLGWSASSFEQIENARCNLSDRRVSKILEAYALTPKEFERLRRDPKLFIAQVCERGLKDRSVERKPRRNHYKIVI